MSRKATLLIVVVALAEIISSCALMSVNPIWNGENPQWRDQYERIAESFIDGKLYFEYDIDPRLEEMDNPYSPDDRRELGVDFHWDHAYYQGKYYMYFGAVPAVLLFVPYKLITGHSLTTYHATQLFSTLIIIGFFVLFFLFRRRLFPKMPAWLCTLAAVALSMASLWYAVARPALYCTAITAGMCFMLWSLYFFFRAFLFEERPHRVCVLAALGAVCGALVFGCRPIMGLANFFIVIPLLVVYLRRQKLGAGQTATLFAVGLTPFLVMMVVLMAYNHARFGSPFEFGQSYQLTNTDQHLYGAGDLTNSSLHSPLDILNVFFGYNGFSQTFPFVGFSGVFVSFPIMLIAPLVLIWKPCRAFVRSHPGLSTIIGGIIVTVLAIVVLDLACSPSHTVRYDMDYYYLLGILVFIAIGSLLESVDESRFRLCCGVAAGLFAITIISASLLLMIPDKAGILSAFPEVMDALGIVVN